jgi:hypothetical protein
LRGAGLAVLAAALLPALLPGAAAAQVRDVCDLMAAREGWRAVLAEVDQRWGVSPGTVIAVLDQESRLRADARGQGAGGANPDRNFGYAQANRRTWAWFLRQSGWEGSTSRTDFEASAHFVGWHFSHVGARNGVAPGNIQANYLIYKQGEGGYRRGASASARALAARVARAAARHDAQLAGCPG